MPAIARFYLALISISAASILITLIPQIGVLSSQLLVIAACLAAMILAEFSPVSLEVRPGQVVSLTVGEAVAIFAISVLGPVGAWIMLVAAAFASLRWRRPWDRVLFNAAMMTVVYSFAALIYGACQPAGAIPYSGPLGLLVFLAVACTYYSTNTLLVSLMVALATGQSVLRIYRESLQQASWPHLLTFTIGAAAAALYASDPWLLTYGALILLLARSIFGTVAALNSETRTRHALAEERVRLYEELHRQQDELTRASKLAALGTLSAGISHEFNNMLTAILGHAQIGEFGETLEEKDEALGVISRVCQRATSITSSLLTFARQREPDLSLNLLQTAIDETLDLVRPDLERSRIHLVTDIADLPAIMCDPGQINQVLLNLITNARDALYGRPESQIRLTLKAHEGQALLTIADNGPGIPPEVLDKIFQPFTTTKKTGNGLGMAICYGIIESHKGRIQIETSPECGTAITIALPLDDQPAVIESNESRVAVGV
ncbi:MAG: hypothetical protein HGA65_13695 [Oscillochloris sp.]|nr:hypothetical protein [Oscillochloris sp.]